MNDVRCPKCGNIDVYYNAETYDQEDYDTEIVRYVRSTCPLCNTIFEWREIFYFSHIEGLTPCEDCGILYSEDEKE